MFDGWVEWSVDVYATRYARVQRALVNACLFASFSTPMNVDCKPAASNKKKYKKTTTSSAPSNSNVRPTQAVDELEQPLGVCLVGAGRRREEHSIDRMPDGEERVRPVMRARVSSSEART